MTDEQRAEEAVAYVKVNQKQLLNHFVADVQSTRKPVSIFMAGSPGAGKTEFSKHLIDEIMGAKGKIVRIDPDEIRVWLPQYKEGRAELFQEAVSTAVSKIVFY